MNDVGVEGLGSGFHMYSLTDVIFVVSIINV